MATTRGPLLLRARWSSLMAGVWGTQRGRPKLLRIRPPVDYVGWLVG